MTSLKIVSSAVSLLVVAWFFNPGQEVSKRDVDVPQQAVVVLSPTKGNNVSGTLMLRQTEEGVHVTGKVKGISPGQHGFHIHEFGDLRDAHGKSAGGHFNPAHVKHGGPDDAKHHAGDLGNIMANSKGVAQVDKTAEGLKLHLVVGRSIVVHDHADDFKSQPSGDAGPRIAVGVIGLAEFKTAKTTQANR